MGEAMLFLAESIGRHGRLGPLPIQPRQPTGPRRREGGRAAGGVADRAAGHGPGRPSGKRAYLGSNYEYTFETELDPIFVVSPTWRGCSRLGDEWGCGLADHGVSVVQVS